MSKLLGDIRKEPQELARCVSSLLGPEKPGLEAAAEHARRARHIYIAGIGSSWNAGLAVVSLFHSRGVPAVLVDASEMLHCTGIPSDSTVIMLSRSGKSVEIVRLLERLRDARAGIIGVTNTTDSPLAREADVCIQLRARFDHLVSVTMYSAFAVAGGLLACAVTRTLEDSLKDRLMEALSAASTRLEGWRQQTNRSTWPDPDAPAYYFLARGPSLATCHEARLLWEEAAKTPATALTTGGFRHGSQEMIRPGVRIGLWVQPEIQREADLHLAEELQALGASVLLVGQDLSDNSADLVVNLPAVPSDWQFLVDAIPAQLAAERLAFLRAEDCDSFRFCPYIVEQETGLSAGQLQAKRF